MKIHKGILRQLIWKIFGRSVQGIEALPVLSGPLKGKTLPKQPAMEQLSMLFGHYEPAVVSEVLRLPQTTRKVEVISTKEKLVFYFSKNFWTHHFLLTKEQTET